MCIFIESDNLKKVIQFSYVCFVARFQCELNQLNWLLNREKLPGILQVIIVSKGER